MYSNEAANKTLGLIHKIRISEKADSPLAILVHGRAGNIEVMSLFKNSIPENWHLIYVQAPIEDPIGGFSWWLVDDQNRSQATAAAANLLKNFITELLAFYEIQPKKTIALGFSQGGAVLSLVMQYNPTLIDALGLIASFVLRNEDHKFSLTGKKIFIAHGTQDQVIPFEKAEAGKEYLQNLGAEVEFHQDECAHKIGTNGMRALKVWIKSFDN